MPNIIDILARALSLRQETALNSITPNRAGGIMYDTLLVLNQMQLEGGALLISKVYASVSAMEADTTPTSDLTGRALKPGQLVVIVTSDSSSSDMGSEYRYNGPGSWTYVGKVGGLPLDTVPTQSSTKGITSGGVYAALAAMKAEGYKYMGIASPGSGGTAPGTPNQPVFYIAGPGSYPNFGSITVASGYLGFIKYSSGSWTVESVAVGKDYDEQISTLDGQISQLEAKVTRLVGKEIFTRDGYYNGTNGSFVSSTVYKATPLLKLQGADIQGIFYLPNAGGGGQLVFFDEGKNFLGQYTTEPSGTIERTIPTSVFPQNSFYVGIVTAATELSYSWVSLGVVNSVVLSDLAREENKELSEKTLPTVERFKNYGRELFSLDGKMYAAKSGNLVSNSAYLGTPILELSGDINGYFYIGGTQYTNYGVSFYDANKAFISGYTGTGNAGMKEIHIPVSGMPANAKYFAVSTIKAMSSDATLVCGWLGEMYRLAEKVEKTGDVDARLVALEESVLEEISQSVVPSKHKRIGIFLDTTPNREKYYLSVTCERTDISSFTIFKCTTAHDGLTNYKTARFGEKVLIERDSAKPSLYIYQSTAPDENFENEVNYTIVYERSTETVQGDIKEIYSEIQSWKGKNIVVFGDSITEFYFDFNGVRMGYCDWIAKITGANVINVGIGGTRLCPRAKLIPVFDETESYLVGDIVYYNDGNGWECYQFTSAHSGAWDSADVAVMTYSTLTGYPDLDIYNLVAASCDTTTAIEHRFDNQIAAAAYLYAKSGSDDNRTIITRLSGIDWSEVDAVIVTGGTNDWGTSGIGELTDADATTLRGAINSIVKKLLSTYKYLKLYWFTCPPNWQNYMNGQPLPPVSDFSDTFTKGGKTLRELASIIKDAVVYNHIPVGDMYNEIGWNTNNFPYYFNAVDGTHPGRGYEQIARYMVSKIKSYQTF